jgi:hypothetical protein
MGASSNMASYCWNKLLHPLVAIGNTHRNLPTNLRNADGGVAEHKETHYFRLASQAVEVLYQRTMKSDRRHGSHEACKQAVPRDAFRSPRNSVTQSVKTAWE